MAGLLCLLTTKETQETGTIRSETRGQSRQAISHLLRIRTFWLIGLVLFAYMVGGQAIVGYLPLYLRESGWQEIHADGALTMFNIIGTVAVIPLAFLSDQLGSRKAVLVPAAIVAIICAGLLSIVSNAFVWGLVIMLGIFYSTYRSLMITLIIETEGVGVKYSGMAVGLVFTLACIGTFITPPVGNSLASISPGMPFVFWATLFFIGAIIHMFLVREAGRKVKDGHISTDIA